MVFFFTPTSEVCSTSSEESLPEGTVFYMGKDKYENEDLIKYGLDEDVWFHVDKLSSAHVYLRPPRGCTIEDMPQGVIDACCALVKANSIEGSKKSEVDVVYTPWTNLRKESHMEVGQIGFFDNKQVTKVGHVKKNNEVVNKLNKTKVESYPDLSAERDARDAIKRREGKERAREAKKEQLEEERRKKEDEELRSYDRIMDEDKMQSNAALREAAKKKSVAELEEDFM